MTDKTDNNDQTSDTSNDTSSGDGASERSRTRTRSRTRARTRDGGGDGSSSRGSSESGDSSGSREASKSGGSSKSGSSRDDAPKDGGSSDGGSEDGGRSGDGSKDGGDSSKRGGRRRRGRRGRGRGRNRGGSSSGNGGSNKGDGASKGGSNKGGSDRGGANKGGSNKGGSSEKELQEAIAKGGTRAAAKRGRSGRRGGGGGGGGGGNRHGRKLGGVPEEVRRAILDGPPKTMLVTSREDRTQICVLEDRRVVEHYVTRKEDVTYVGNIYMARVQNVLPGMEAAFLDIGKGRNGVLYAGEVLYDELDLEDGTENPRIEDALKSGQTLLVQVTKDPMGTKGPRLTMHLSLAGRYMVLAPNSDLFGISRKLSDAERDRLRKTVKRLKPKEHGVIVRTAAADASDEALEADLQRLLTKWEKVAERAKDAKALTPVYEEPPLVVKVIRDNFGPDFERAIIDDEDLYGQVRDYLEEVAPDLLDKVELYQPKDDEAKGLFAAYDADDQLRKAMDRKVWLPSGGYLIIEATEAMKVIDVNTGKFTGGKDSNLEEVVLKTNLEAAEEIVRQLRLRDMGGIVIIDFIDMLLKSNQDQVLRTLKKELLRDRTKTRVSDISRLGLVQMTRKNVSQGLVESFSHKCDTCKGHGYISELGD